MGGVITFGEIENKSTDENSEPGTKGNDESTNPNKLNETSEGQQGNSNDNQTNNNEQGNNKQEDSKQENGENGLSNNEQANNENGTDAAKSAAYELMDDESTKVIKGYKIQFKCNIEYANFLSTGELYIDGQLVNSENYTVSEGCTLITLNDDYASTLAIGSHTVRVAVSDGAIVGSFEILNESTNTDISNSPKAGDYIVKYVILLATAILAIHFIKSKSKNNKKK